MNKDDCTFFGCIYSAVKRKTPVPESILSTENSYFSQGTEHPFFCPYVYPQLIQLQSYRRQKENLFLRHSYFASLFCLCMERIKCPIFFLKKRATPGLFMFIFALTGPINMASFLFLFIFNQL